MRFPPPALRLVIVTRADPPIGLGRLRLDGSLTEIRARRSGLHAGRGRRAVRRARHRAGARGSRDALAAHRGLGGGAAPGGRVAAAPSRPARLHRALRRHRRHDQRLPGQRGAGPPAAGAARLPAAHVGRRHAERRARRRAHRDARTATRCWRAWSTAACSRRRSTSTAPGIATTRCSPSSCAPSCARSSPTRSPQLHRRAATWLAAHGDDAAALRHAAAGGAWDLAADLTTDALVPHDDQRRDGHAAADPRDDAAPSSSRPRPSSRSRSAARCSRAATTPARSPTCAAPRRARRCVPPERRAQFAASRAAMGLYEGRLRGDPIGRAAGRPRAARARRRPRERRPEQRRAVLRPRPARHRRAVDRRPRRGDRAPRAGPRRRPRRGQTTGPRSPPAPTSRWRARFRGELAARAAPRRRGRRAGRAPRLGAVGAGGCRLLRAGGRRHPARPARRGRGASWPARSEALHETRERPLRAVHALNRALLLSDAGEPEAALGVLQVARERGRRLAAARPAGGPAAGPGGAAARRASASASWARALLERAERETATSVAVANAMARLRLLEGDPSAARDVLAPHLGSAATARRPTARRCRSAPRRGCSTRWRSTRSPSTTTPRARWSARSTSPSRPACSRLIVEHGNRVRPLLHRHVRHGTAHPAIVGEALETIEQRGARAVTAGRRPAGRAAERARAGDPALPAHDDVQPRDRRRAVRLGQHGQDPPEGDLPQARCHRAGARPCSAAASSGSCRDALAALGQPAHLDQLQAERLQPVAAARAARPGRGPGRGGSSPPARLRSACVERVQHGRAHPAADADLVAGIRHRRPPRQASPAGGVSLRHPRGVIAIRGVTPAG